MHLDQMFPKKTLDAEDLGAFSPDGVVVTIESIDYKTMPSRTMGEPEIVYYMHVREFKKPFKLNTFNAYAIADLFGTKDTDQWAGRTIRLLARKKMGTDRQTGRPKAYWAFDVDMMLPAESPALPAKQDISGWAAAGHGPRLTAGAQPRQQQLPANTDAPPGGVLAPIGEDLAATVVSSLQERGRTVDDFKKALIDAGIDDLIAGKDPPKWPHAVLPAARKFCTKFPKVAAPMSAAAISALKAGWRPAPPAEVVDRSTGEVITTPRPSRHGPVLPEQQPGPPDDLDGYEPINEDDIPF
jgi:hypothetical protein